VTQVAGGVGARPGMALPIRVHDLLLGFAGRIDDDALADARELLASAELDRSLEFLVGCLVAGRIAITAGQRTELDSLFHQVYLDPGVLSRVVVDDTAAVVRHRFGGGAINGEPAGHGVAEAARRVLDVLPDVRSVWAVWRTTPAGAVSGPVPHRVVLVGVGPAGFAPATAYRLENALRRNGIRASVEVLRDGTDAPDYHHAAMQYASQVPFARQAPTNPNPVRARAAASPIAPPAAPPAPASRPDFSAPGRRSRLEQSAELPALPATVSAPQAPAPPPAPESDISDTAQMARQTRLEAPDDPLASAKPPARPQPQPPQNQTSWLTTLPESTSSKPPRTNGSSAPNPGEDSLSDQEKHLLRQLQEELARREQEESAEIRSLESSGRHGGQPGQFEWPNSNGSSTIINGVPPQRPDQRR
jgi:hypothetical protein